MEIYFSLVLFLLFYDWQYFFGVVINKLRELTKRRLKVQEKNMSGERALNFDQ